MKYSVGFRVCSVTPGRWGGRSGGYEACILLEREIDGTDQIHD